MAAEQTRDLAPYARNARFVSDSGSPVLELVAPKLFDAVALPYREEFDASSRSAARRTLRCGVWWIRVRRQNPARRERAGFRIDSIALIPRPPALPGDITGFLEYLAEVRSVLAPQLVNEAGVWIADYVRLRFAATRTTGG